MALVPYSETPAPVLAKLHETSASFDFANRRLSLRQDWRRRGVAAVVWDAAVVMCMYLELGKVELQGKEVVELGAGTGLVGIVAALHGARVTITDRQPALQLLSDNVEANVPSGGGVGSASVSELTWGEGLDRFPAGGFDLVLGADIVYLEDSFPALLRTLLHLCSTRTTLLLACKLRYDRDHSFLELLRQSFTVEEAHYDAQRDIHVYRAAKLPTRRDL